MADVITTFLSTVIIVSAMIPEATNTIIQTSKSKVNYRLPKIVKPISYDLYIEPKLIDNEPFRFIGNVTIKVNVIEDTNYITLHAYELRITRIIVNNLDPNEKYLDPDTHFLTIYLEESLVKGCEYDIVIDFNGRLRKDMTGFYKSLYITPEGEIRWLAATQFKATHARRAFPCFDEPEFKATFKITINTPPGYHSLSNMPMSGVSYPNIWNVYKFEETERMSTYLVAFIVFEHKSLIVTDTIITVWSRTEFIHYIEKVWYLYYPNFIKFLETYTGIKYTFPKIDYVALPDLKSGATENWGLITYREPKLLYFEGFSSETDKQEILAAIAHEVTHMWFGNLVTLQWWKYTWLNEAFARYFQYLNRDHMENLTVIEQFVVHQQQMAYETDSITNAQPLTNDCETPAEISSMFSTITSSKGACVLNMASNVLTPKTFRKGLQKYLIAHRWSNTVPKDLFDALEEQRKEDNIDMPQVHQFLEPWTTQPGYPVLNVKRKVDTITITQERFLLNSNEKDREKLKWWIPLSWSTDYNGFKYTEAKEWILPNDTSKVLEIILQRKQWIIFNNQVTGYYRVNYDTANWELIIECLQDRFELIHVMNRAQLLDDALNLARAGKLKYSLALRLTTYLKNEHHYVPWASALNAFSYLDKQLKNVEGHDDFKNYVINLLQKIYAHLELHGGSLSLRDLVLNWLCRLHFQECINKTRNSFETYKQTNNRSHIGQDLSRQVFCTALEHGGTEEWNFLWKLYLDSRIPSEKITILHALGCTKNTTLLRQLLEMTIFRNTGIARQDEDLIFSAVCSNTVGVDEALEFLENYYAIIAYNHGGMDGGMDEVSRRITVLAKEMTTEDQVQRLQKFIFDNLRSEEKTLKIAVEAAQANLNWAKSFKDEIVTWLRDTTARTTPKPTELKGTTARTTPKPTELKGGCANSSTNIFMLICACVVSFLLKRSLRISQ